MSDRKEQRFVLVKVPDAILESMRRDRFETRRTNSEIVTEALTAHYARNKPKAKRSRQPAQATA